MTTAFTLPGPRDLPPPPPRPLLELADLRVSFDLGGQRVPAVNGLSLSLYPRQTLALVGESGCGKSVTALTVLQLVACPPGMIEGGEIRLDGRDLLALSPRQMLRVRGRDIAMIFQEPMTSLNPVYSIGAQLVESIRLHQHVSRTRARALALRALADVSISEPARRLRSYPHEFSGGMRQRVMAAMALACQPRVLLADEPTTALDVTIQAQILSLLRSMQQRRGMGVMLITHDLGVVAEHADVVCVMYAGRVVEYATVFDLFEKAYHPYTRGLLASIPRLHGHRHRLTTVAEILEDPAEFEKLPGHALGLVPWWPDRPPPDDLVPGGPDARLYEIEPGHWVGCWRTRYLADHPTTRPDLSFRRPGAVASAGPA